MAQDVLKKLYFFRDITSEDLFKIQQIAHPKTHIQGDSIFRQKEDAKAMYVIVMGTVRIEHSTTAGQSVEMAVLGTGAHFGEMAFIDGAKRNASAVAMESTKVLCIDYTDLRMLLQENPKMAATFYRAIAIHLCGRLSTSNHDLGFAREKLRKRS